MENPIDMEKDQMDILREIINRHIPGKEVWAYGSRVTWNAEAFSDLDLVIFDCDPNSTEDFKEALEESDLLFSVDVMEWESLPENFREDIKRKHVVVKRKRKSDGWREARLGEVADVVGGGTPSTKVPEYWNGNIPWLTPRDISNFSGRYISKGERNISELGLSKSSAELLPKGSILLTTRDPVGYLAIAESKVSTNQGFRSLVPGEEVNGLFLFYLLKGNIEYLKSQSEGTAFEELSGSTLKSLSFLFPPLPEQEAIAEVLSSLDDKIELLCRQNKTLENMAQMLFRKCFINVLKSGWKEAELRDFITWTTGYSYRSKDLNPSSTALVTLKNFARDGSFRMDGFKEYTGDFKENQVVHQGDLVIAHTGLSQQADAVGNPALVIAPREYKTLVITMDLIKVEIKGYLSREFLYYLMKTKSFKEHCLGLANGSTVLHLNRDAVASFRFLLPPKDRIKSFSSVCQNFIAKQFINYSHINMLRHLRDVLLPKLVSGELRIT